MRKVKSLAAVLLAAVMMVGSVMPASAAVTSSVNKGSETYVKTDNIKKYENYPVWVWWHGYCYYYDGPYSYLKNCVTPDGYTVDEYGRWTENGVAVHNGFGSVKVGTDEYLGKSSNEIWSLMKGKLINAFENSLTMSGLDSRVYSHGYGDNSVWYDFDTALMGASNHILHNPTNGDYITAWIGHNWSDMANDAMDSAMMAYYAAQPDVKEKMIKAIVGDNVGQELFNYINEHAKKTSSGYKEVLDANGQLIRGYYKNVNNGNNYFTRVFVEDPNGYDTKVEYMSNVGDGINASTMDLSMWKSRKTDYGKTFSVEANGGALMIHVYN